MGGPGVDAATATNDDVPLPADTTARGGTSPQNKCFQGLQGPCFEVGQICLIRPCRYVSSRLRRPDGDGATTTKRQCASPSRHDSPSGYLSSKQDYSDLRGAMLCGGTDLFDKTVKICKLRVTRA
jgi:hypothetical protein